MDKNTITGLVLMAAVMFGFLWLSKPDQAEQTESTRQEQATTANSNTQTDATVALTPADSTALARNAEAATPLATIVSTLPSTVSAPSAAPTPPAM